MKKFALNTITNNPFRSLAVAGAILLGVSGFLFFTGNNTQTSEFEASNADATEVVDQAETTDVSETSFDEVTLAQIIENPDDFIQKEIKLSGTIRDVDDRRLLQLLDGAGNAVYVITPRALSSDELARTNEFLENGAPATLEGALFRLNAANIRERLEVALSEETSAAFAEPQLTVIVRNITIGE